ncbi:MAG TPA: heavy metal translocating P-type ATPase [Candidatus Acidoferrum sp.]|nr:heavy metal translocating P-type ATPase [Candidatus Acidoferrum sp.]
MERDPVCGMSVDPVHAKASAEHNGKTYYFCCEGCGSQFRATPERYLNGKTPSPAMHEGGLAQLGGANAGVSSIAPASLSSSTGAPLATAIENGPDHPADASVAAVAPEPKRVGKPLKDLRRTYVCPMDPEVRQNESGACPKCGMALEPEVLARPETTIEYRCPMHPRVVREKPGNCPKCGMTLEPRQVAADEENPELDAMSLRFWISIILTLPILLFGMNFGMPGRGLSSWLPPRTTAWIELALATPVVLWAGWPFFQRGWDSIKNRSANMFTLISIGIGVAYVYSLTGVLLPGIFPASFRGKSGVVPVYFEAAAAITTLVLLGQVLELRARERTGNAIRVLLKLSPSVARLVRADGTEMDIPQQEVAIGDLLRVRPGATVPTDGIVTDGTSAVDESLMSGEPMAVEKTAGSRVVGGTINGTGTFVMRAERVGNDTVLYQIIRMVSEAQRSRAPVQSLTDRVASYFVPGVIAVAIATFIGWSLLGPEPKFAYALLNAVAVLLIACPCELGLATPMAIMVATGRGALSGVLVKNAETLELLEKVDTIVLDKTGTITEGHPYAMSVAAADGHSELEVLRLAATLERPSEHPLASAVVAAANERNVEAGDLAGFHYRAGKGITGTVDGKEAALGNRALFVELGLPLGELDARAQTLESDGQTVIFIAVAGKAVGILGIADPIKSTAPEAIEQLHRQKLQIVMLTGDSRGAANVAAKKLGIEHVEAEVLPAQKSEIVKRLQAEGHVVAMAGDGINDAPALSQANVGIAMSTGTDVAMQSAGITLLRGDLRGIVRARALSKLTMRNIRQNLFFAFAYNTVGVPIAAGVLYPFFGVLLNPVIASAAMTFSSVSVISNALRLRRAKL